MKLQLPEEKTVVRQILYTNLGVSGKQLKQMQRSYRTIKPAKELLRASAKPENDTLLRATQYTDEKAQEQLLRPSAEEK